MNASWSKERRRSAAEECVSYFRELPVFDRLLRGFREKYASYGSFSGTVSLRNLKPEDIEALEGFFRRSFHGQKSVRVSAGRFLKALGESRFSEVSGEELLRLYFGEEILGRRESRSREEERLRAAFQKIKEEFPEEISRQWLDHIWKERPQAYYSLLRKYQESGQDCDVLEEGLRLGAEILLALPARQGKAEYLPVFAAGLTGNPHYFDEGTSEGRFLYQIVRWYWEMEGNPAEDARIFPALQKQKTYLKAGILRDDISNYAIVSGVRGRKKDGCFHVGMEGFGAERDAVMVPLSVLAGWSGAQCAGGRIYIVENPSVFSMLCGKLEGNFACMCMNGQPRLACVLLLDLLARSETEIFYAGDFDPEGLLIAQKLRQYYRGPFSYWHMSAEDYRRGCSAEEISPRRLKMLERVTDEELVPAAAAMRESRRAGYQENIWKVYEEELSGKA